MNQEISTPIPNFTAQLSPTPRGARLARQLAGEQLRAWGLPLDPAELIVGELAANAATHGRVAGRDFRLTLYVVGDTLRIEVTDTRGDRLPCPVSAPPPDADGGRGLLLVAALAERWGTAPGLSPRKTVWAEVRVGPAEGEIGPAGVRNGSGHSPAAAPAAAPAQAAAPGAGPRFRSQLPAAPQEWPSSAVSSSPMSGTEPESRTGRSGKGSTRVSSTTGAAGCGGLGMTAASEWAPQP